ncbi:3-oxoacyl-reductase [Macrophomina phaseolina]|uniref:3-oxoacyl-reductase n=1 Tax=Macrophomina phaseolina TaxID=35725 RepID=A0ABQ8GHP4_9PEZI|nr:3-oxoacyl-reductase [Macrophomina phaseolina]
MPGSALSMESNPPKVLEQDLVGKNAIVTGASRGIGRAIALHLALRGANVLGTCSSPSSLERIDALASTVRDLYASTQYTAPRITGLDANLLSPETPERLADAVSEQFGALNILVNNAPYEEFRHIGQLDADYVQRVLMGNLQTLVLSVDVLFRKSLFQPNSRIVNVSSAMTRGYRVSDDFGVFGATKSAMEYLTRTWADVFGKHPSMRGTTVNTLLVGGTSTEAFTDTMKDKTELIERLVSDQSVGDRPGTPEDVANVAGLLVSERAGWITGSVVAAEGGIVKVL